MKRFFAVLLAVLMLVTMIPVSVSAADETPEAQFTKWSTNKVETGTLAQMLARAEQSGSGFGTTVTLLKDIDGSSWEAIEWDNTGEFTLDGNGHTITGLTQPLFGRVSAGARIDIRELNIVNADIVQTPQLNPNPDPDDSLTTYTNAAAGILANHVILDQRGTSTFPTYFNVTDCTITNSKVKGVFVGAMVGLIEGKYEKASVTISDCVVSGNEIATIDTTVQPSGDYLNDSRYIDRLVNSNAGALIGQCSLGQDYSNIQMSQTDGTGIDAENPDIEISFVEIKNNSITTNLGKNPRRTGKVVGRVTEGVVSVMVDETQNVIVEKYYEGYQPGNVPSTLQVRSHDLVHGRIDGAVLMVKGGAYDKAPILETAADGEYNQNQDEVSFYYSTAVKNTLEGGRIGYYSNPYAQFDINVSNGTYTTTVGSRMKLPIVFDSATGETFAPIENIVWTSNDPTIVSFDENGAAIMNAVGQTQIECTIQYKNGQYGNSKIRMNINVVEQPVVVERVTYTPNTFNLIIGETVSLTNPTITPENADYTELTWRIWSGSNGIVNLDTRTGTVTALAPGKVTIEVGAPVIMYRLDGILSNYTNNAARVTINVTEERQAASVTLNHRSLQLAEGKTRTLTATIAPEDGNYTAIEWTSSKPEVATVDENGKVTTVAPGWTDIQVTVTTEIGKISAKCNVTVTAAPNHTTGVTLDKDAIALVAGNSQTLAATLSPENGVYTAINWASSNPAVATVDATGKVTAVAAGTTDVTVTVTTEAGTVSDTCAVTVSAVAAKIDGAVYGSFDDALAAALPGDTVTMMASAEAATTVINKNITLNLNNNTLMTAGLTLAPNTSLTLMNGRVAAHTVARAAAGNLITSYGDLTLVNMTMDDTGLAAGAAVIASLGGTTTIESSSVTAANGKAIVAVSSDASAPVTVKANASVIAGDVVLNNTTADPNAVKLTLTSPVEHAYSGINLSFAPGSNTADVNRKDDSAVTPPDGFTWAGDEEGNKVLVKDISAEYAVSVTGRNGTEQAVYRVGDALSCEITGTLDLALFEVTTVWSRDGEEIFVGDVYTLTREDVGCTITARVSLVALAGNALGNTFSANFIVPQSGMFDTPLVGVSQIKLVDAETGKAIVGATVELWRIGTTGNRTLQKTYTSTDSGRVTLRTLSSRYTYEVIVVAAEGYAQPAPITFRIQFNQPLYQTIALEKLPAETPAE